jgi:uncharacterized membrane protein YeaQ/YmgE (transglycosylase-associated protein family)
MPTKNLIFLLMAVGSIIGGYVPSLWGAGMLSFSSIFTSGAGALVGLWLAFRLSK